MSTGDTYTELIDLFERHGVSHRLIDHAPEGSTEAVSALRGHDPAEAAKCIVLIVKPDKRTTIHVLAVVPGDRRVDLAAVKGLFGARYVGFADAATAERLAHAVPGTMLPFSFDPDLAVIADPEVVASTRLFFNAARLDRSVVISGADYRRVAAPRVARIAEVQSSPRADR